MLDGVIVQIRRGATEGGERGLAIATASVVRAQKRMGPSGETMEDDGKRGILT